MTAQDFLQMLREMRDVAFATVDEQGMPEVRIIDVMIVENSKIYFCTARGKDFYRQLQNSGRIAIVGLNKDLALRCLKWVNKYVQSQRASA